MSVILGIESTCDETAAAVVADGWDVRSNVVATQFELHAKYRGVVPEIASRAHLENILPVIEEATAKAGVSLKDLDAISVTHRPGLIGSLLIGVTAAKTLAWGLSKPLIGVDHVHAHLYSVMLEHPDASLAIRAEPSDSAAGTPPPDVTGTQLVNKLAASPLKSIARRNSALPGQPDEPFARRTEPSGSAGASPASDVTGTQLVIKLAASPLQSSTRPSDLRPLPAFPALGVVCSGGHTALYRIGDWLDVQLIGSTIDDAVGEAYDKVAAILGLGYPGGPLIDQLALRGDASAVRFPRSLLERDSLDFSFSGLKTAVLYHVRGHKGRERTAAALSEQQLADVAASFQAACIDVITEKLKRGARQINAKSINLGGGVSANRGLRAAMTKFPLPSFFPPMVYCTDNAAMSAGLAHVLLKSGRISLLDLDAITYSQFVE